VKGFLEILLPFAIILLLFGFSSQNASTAAQPSRQSTPEIPSFSEEDENLFEVTFIVTFVPEDTPQDASIYMMGNFNNWLVGDENYRFEKMDDGTYQLTLRMSQNTEIEYKYNLGNYDYIEKNYFGDERENRTYKFEYNFDEVRNEIESW